MKNRGYIHYSSFSSLLKNGPNKLTLDWKGLLLSNTLAYWAHGLFGQPRGSGIKPFQRILCDIYTGTVFPI
jgi:hypothetical protein